MGTGEPAPPLTWAAQESCPGVMGTGELSLPPPQSGIGYLVLRVLVCVMGGTRAITCNVKAHRGALAGLVPSFLFSLFKYFLFLPDSSDTQALERRAPGLSCPIPLYIFSVFSFDFLNLTSVIAGFSILKVGSILHWVDLLGDELI